MSFGVSMDDGVYEWYHARCGQNSYFPTRKFSYEPIGLKGSETLFFTVSLLFFSQTGLTGYAARPQ